MGPQKEKIIFAEDQRALCLPIAFGISFTSHKILQETSSPHCFTEKSTVTRRLKNHSADPSQPVCSRMFAASGNYPSSPHSDAGHALTVRCSKKQKYLMSVFVFHAFDFPVGDSAQATFAEDGTDEQSIASQSRKFLP